MSWENLLSLLLPNHKKVSVTYGTEILDGGIFLLFFFIKKPRWSEVIGINFNSIVAGFINFSKLISVYFVQI